MTQILREEVLSIPSLAQISVTVTTKSVTLQALSDEATAGLLFCTEEQRPLIEGAMGYSCLGPASIGQRCYAACEASEQEASIICWSDKSWLVTETCVQPETSNLAIFVVVFLAACHSVYHKYDQINSYCIILYHIPRTHTRSSSVIIVGYSPLAINSNCICTDGLLPPSSCEVAFCCLLICGGLAVAYFQTSSTSAVEKASVPKPKLKGKGLRAAAQAKRPPLGLKSGHKSKLFRPWTLKSLQNSSKFFKKSMRFGHF